MPPPVRPSRLIQPRILDRFVDSFGALHVIDEEGEHILTLGPRLVIENGKLGIPENAPDTQANGSTFGVGNNWSGGTTEIRWSSSDDAGNNRSYVWNGLYGHTSGFRTYGNGHFAMRIQDDAWQDIWVDVSGGWALLAARDKWVGHDAAGYGWAQIGVGAGYVDGTSFKSVSGWQDHGLADYTVLPYAPQNIKVRDGSVTTTSFGVDYTRNSYDGIDQDEVQWATDAGFSNVVWTDRSAAGFSQPSTANPPFQLTPGTTHYVRVRSHTGAGWGPWSGTVSQTTLPAVPPGFLVASSPSGSQATLTFSPPGGVTGVSKYVWERRATGTSTPVATGESTVITTVVASLVPGNSYDWRASAFIGTYQSPWTGWTTLVQAKPNVDPGQYFDGSTPDVADIDYSWSGTANASTSIGTAKGVAGWAVIAASGAAVLYRITAGILQSDFAARVQVTADPTDWGQITAGQRAAAPYWTEVTPGATYIGSIHVRPGKSQRMSALVEWYSAAGAKLSSMAGASSVIAGGTWARLVVGGIAPAGAAWAVVQVFDAQGTGWTKWLGGDTFDLDGAMISLNEEFPYFDGDFLADGTYVYEWADEPNASVSTRTPLAQVSGQSFSNGPGAVILGAHVPANRALTDPDCEQVPEPPRPPIVATPCIDDIGVWRRYYSEIPANLVPDWMDVVTTLFITSGSLAARQVRIRYYENPDALPPLEVDTTTWISEQIISYMPPLTELTVDGVTQHVWAEVSDSAPISADHLLYGSNGKPATWPVLSCGIAYLVSVEVPIAEPEGNVSVAASLTART